MGPKRRRKLIGNAAAQSDTRDRSANLMIKRYGDEARAESAKRADDLAAAGDDAGAATWRRITEAVCELENNTPPGPLH